MLDHTDQEGAHAKALRNADFASLSRRAVTDSGRTLIDDIYRQIVDYEARSGTRKRHRVGKARAFIRALEGFVGDLLWALGRKEPAAAWVYRPVTQRSFTDDAVKF